MTLARRIGEAGPKRLLAVQQLDSVDAIPDMCAVGRVVAERKVQKAHFDRFPAR